MEGKSRTCGWGQKAEETPRIQAGLAMENESRSEWLWREQSCCEFVFKRSRSLQTEPVWLKVSMSPQGCSQEDRPVGVWRIWIHQPSAAVHWWVGITASSSVSEEDEGWRGHQRVLGRLVSFLDESHLGFLTHGIVLLVCRWKTRTMDSKSHPCYAVFHFLTCVCPGFEQEGVCLCACFTITSLEKQDIWNFTSTFLYFFSPDVEQECTMRTYAVALLSNRT